MPTAEQHVILLAGGLIQRLNELKREEENVNKRRWTPGVCNGAEVLCSVETQETENRWNVTV